MKKSLVLAMAMALGVTASAYAAQPFSDVPAGHWAYDSIAKLAAAGVIDGYGDNTFGGDKLMTRYEMAQITARAMAKGANVDKLAAEFADELDNLGVRVANLEKKADNVKITGQARFRYYDTDADATHHASLRSRIWITGQVNDDWSYTGMIQNTQEFNNKTGDEKTEFKRAYVDGKIGGVKIHAGRWDECTSTANILDSYVDGVQVSYGDKVKVYGMALKGADNDAITDGFGGTLTEKAADRIYIVGAEAALGKVNAYVNYFKADGVDPNFGAADNGEKEIYNIGANLDVAKDLNLAYEYMWSDKKYDKEVSKDGFVATLAYKGASADTPGSWGVAATYFDQPINAILSPTTDATTFLDEGGYKGYGLTANYGLAKNMVLELLYFDTEAKKGNSDEKMFYADLYLTF